MFDAPVSPYVAGHYTRRLSVGQVSPTGSVRRMPIATAPPALDSSATDLQRDPWDAAYSVQLNERLAPAGEIDRAKSPVPSINLFSPGSPNGTSALAPRKLFIPDDAPAPAYWRTVLHNTACTLFPSLVDLSSRPWLWKIIAVCSAPAIFALTLTLPVVVNERAAEHQSDELPVGTPSLEAQLIDYDESDAEEELMQAQMEAEAHMHDVHFNKWLTATQCALSPVFCVSVLFGKLYCVNPYSY
jgi:sodium/potassium/calcium exchanger 6